MILLALAPGAAAGGDVSLASSVMFATRCARCHEGECSGRLSFETGPEASAAHIRRHAGEVSDASVVELFALLERMKKDCAYPPFAAPLPEDGVWTPPLLRRLCVPSRKSYMVPLGTLSPGDYSLELRFDGAPHVHVEVVTRRFEILVDEALTIEDGRGTAAFRLVDREPTFLRLLGDAPVSLVRVALERGS